MKLEFVEAISNCLEEQMLATMQPGEHALTDVMDRLELDQIVHKLGDETTGEVSTNVFLRYLVDTYNFTFEFARSVLYRLLEVGTMQLTTRYTLVKAA